MIYIVGIIITIFLTFILLTKKNKSLADKILIVWLSVILIHLTLNALLLSKEFLKYPYFLGFEIPMPLLHGPLLFLYTTSHTNEAGWRTHKLWHFIPFALALLSLLPFLTLSFEDKVSIYMNGGSIYSTLKSVIFIGIVLSGIAYITLSLQSLLKHKKMVKDNYSYTEGINMDWLFKLIIGLFCIWIIVLFAPADEYIFSSVVLYVLFIGYYGIKQVGIFTNSSPIMEDMASQDVFPMELSSEVEPSKYEKSLLSDDQIQAIYNKLVQIMEEKELYLTPELNLMMVSQQLDVHPNTLSQVINRMEQKNFFDYINSLRIEKFKIRLAEPESQKYTLLSLAYECGFNSKTSFNRNFKNSTGLSPSDYQKEVNAMFKK